MTSNTTLSRTASNRVTGADTDIEQLMDEDNE